jgi:sulfatase modifying factor 1
MRRTAIAIVLFAIGPLRAGDPLKEKEFTNTLGMKFVRIEPGEFIMGTAEAPPKTKLEWLGREWDESPAYPVKIARAFHLGTTEVTNAQFEQFDPAHKKLRGIAGASFTDDEPVTHVTWLQAADFCTWLAKREGKPYRLPTEAEWEYACRAGTKTPFYTGDKLAPEQANFGVGPAAKKQTTVKVGSYPPNPWGLFDMAGNVAEWCADWYGPYEGGKQTDPTGRLDGDFRVVRGWSYLPVNHPAGVTRFCRSANRSAFIPHDANRTTGFRVTLGEPSATPHLGEAPRPMHQRDVKQTAATLAKVPAGPYFVDFRKSEKMTPISTDDWGPLYGAHNHFTAVCVCPNGDVLAAWYTTVAESGRECAQAATRLRAGSDKWDPPSFFFGTPDCNTHAPVLLRDSKRIYHFCTQSLAGWDDAAEAMRTSDDSGATWSKPRIIVSREHPRRMSQPCTAFVSKTGKIVVALDGDFAHRDERIMLSGDKGETWKVAGGDIRKAAGKYAIHPSIVERADGSILSFMRGPDPMPAFASSDEGETWQPVSTPFPGITSGQKAPALKLAGGGLLLCSFDNKKTVIGGGTFAALSFDDGKTWPHVRKVEGVGGYMSLDQAANGLIYLVGSRSTCVAFNEAWLKEGVPYPPAK